MNRIEDSDSDVGSPVKSKASGSDSEETKDKERKLQYLINKFPHSNAGVSISIFNLIVYSFR